MVPLHALYYILYGMVSVLCNMMVSGPTAISATGMTHDHRPNLAGRVWVSEDTTLTILLDSVGALHVHFV